MSDQMPHTIEEFAALPEGDFGAATYEFTDADRQRGYAEINGKRIEMKDGVLSVKWPVDPGAVAYFDDGGISSYRDHEGVAWQLGRYADGRWFRRRTAR